ncbi:uncharacterized protein LY89DRAFT_727226 [Mollisia scopiformis]|uniref:DUF7918 domain-containing protein n=1 Tax=Mollisia scopiformis TaxID=149040 RepID=A0A194XV39_MOLSC|nr:uncharacterized protein LY89DRAFT_727226 [Mollisia scopiformis]KUJ24190.1 hypothetical protein LY89DRAFT_727226 [Mollisia scopiformis]
MAILEGVPGVEVCILVDGNALPKYHDEDETAEHAIKLVSNFVEAISDKTTFPDFISNNKVVKKLAHVLDGAFFASPEDDTQQLLKKFKFRPIVANDTAARDIKKDADAMKQAGEIVVQFFRAGTPTLATPEKSTPLGDGLQMNQAEIHEKALKGEAKSHTTYFGDAVETRSKIYHWVRLLDGKDKPIATFKLKYRSADALKSLLIIRAPSPKAEPIDSSLSASPPPTDMNDPETMRQFREFLRTKNRGGNSGVKTESKVKTETKIKSEFGVKREGTQSGSRRNAPIDLTEEDSPAERKRDRSHRVNRAVNLTPNPSTRIIEPRQKKTEVAGKSAKRQKTQARDLRAFVEDCDDSE